MTKLKLTFAAALLLGSTFAFAGTPKTDAKANSDTKSDAKVEAKTEAKTDAEAGADMYYWFDANTHQYIGHLESSGCDNSVPQPCALGYLSVSNPSNPTYPGTGTTPNKTETGVRSQD